MSSKGPLQSALRGFFLYKKNPGLQGSPRPVFVWLLGQFTRNYTQTVNRAADNKRRYAPGWVHSTCLLRGFQRGQRPIWHTTLRSKV